MGIFFDWVSLYQRDDTLWKPFMLRTPFEQQSADEQMATLSSIGAQERLLHGKFWCKANGPYKTLADLWDE